MGSGEVRARLRLRVGFRLCELRLERGTFVAEEGRDRLLGVEISLQQSVAAELTRRVGQKIVERVDRLTKRLRQRRAVGGRRRRRGEEEVEVAGSD